MIVFLVWKCRWYLCSDFPNMANLLKISSSIAWKLDLFLRPLGNSWAREPWQARESLVGRRWSAPGPNRWVRQPPPEPFCCCRSCSRFLFVFVSCCWPRLTVRDLRCIVNLLQYLLLAWYQKEFEYPIKPFAFSNEKTDPLKTLIVSHRFII